MRMQSVVLGFLVSVMGAACSGGLPNSNAGAAGDTPPDPVDAGPPVEAPELGKGDHSAGSVTLTVLATGDQGLNIPRDLKFHNTRPNELWVVNRADDSTVTIFDPTTASPRVEKKIDGFALHFMEEVSSLSFGKDDQFATCQESHNTYNGQAPGNDFMGPALWSADPAIYAAVDPIGLGSHLDMLHESPLCMGIAHVSSNVFWAFDGNDGSLVYYDFVQDHGAGMDDHSDGYILRYATGLVAREPNVPSHMEFSHDDNHLYVADTGHGRIARLDVLSGTAGPRLPAKEMGTTHRRYLDAVVEDVVPSGSGMLEKPSGLVLHNGFIYVTDNATSRISAFRQDTGERVNWLETGLPAGSIMGLTFGPDGKVYFVDAIGNRVFRVDVQG